MPFCWFYHDAAHLTLKGMKALCRCRNIFANDASILLHIYKQTIHPILLYGAELWGYISPSQLKNGLESFIKKQLDTLEMENIHTKFCKFVLGVRTYLNLQIMHAWVN